MGHIHDETVNETPFGEPTVSLKEIAKPWQLRQNGRTLFDIPLKAEGFTSNYYKKINIYGKIHLIARRFFGVSEMEGCAPHMGRFCKTFRYA